MPLRLPVFRPFVLTALTAVTAVTAFTASAQAVDTPSAAPSQAAPLPIAASASTPAPVPKPAPLPYRSVFDSYQPFADDKVLPWKGTNQTVEQIGGWRAYAKEAPEMPSHDAQDAAPTRADPHAGHGKH